MAHVSLTLLVLKTRQVEQLRLFYQTLGVEMARSSTARGRSTSLAGPVTW